MVKGKPPRRSTPSVGPVTIDLDAKDINPVDPQKAEAEADGIQPSTTDEQTAQPVTGETAAAAADDTAIQDTPVTETATENETETPAPDSTVNPTEDRTPDDDTAPQYAETAHPADESATPEPAPVASTRKPSTASLVAPGIFGGIVALALAGSMQYAGYLPPLAAGRTQGADIAALRAEIDGLKQQITDMPVASPPVDQTALEARLAALEESAAETSGQAAPADTAALEEKIAALQTGLDEARSAAAASGSNTATLAHRLDEAERKLNEPRDDVEVARAIASAALKATIDRGGPFLTELETLAGVVPDDPAIAGLRPLAAAGVPSRAELLRQYPDVATTILEALHRPDPDEGILDRLKGSALSLVRVRPVGNVTGESPDAVVARIEDKMRNGDLPGAALEWDLLPEAGKAVSAQFKQALDARISVEELVNGTLQRAVTSTGQQG